MRTLSLNFRRELFAQESGEVPIFLLTISHASLVTPERLSTDATALISSSPLSYGTVSRGNTYLYAGVELILPDELDRNAPAARLSIQNVDRRLVPLARSISTPAQCKIECVLLSALDTVETTWPAFDMTSLEYDAAQLTFDLTIDALASEPYPALKFGPAYFPALFY